MEKTHVGKAHVVGILDDWIVTLQKFEEGINIRPTLSGILIGFPAEKTFKTMVSGWAN